MEDDANGEGGGLLRQLRGGAGTQALNALSYPARQPIGTNPTIGDSISGRSRHAPADPTTAGDLAGAAYVSNAHEAHRIDYILASDF